MHIHMLQHTATQCAALCCSVLQLICFCVLCIFISRFILGIFIYYLRVEERKKQKVLCGGWDVREHKRKKVFVTEKLGKCVGRVCGESGVAKMFLALRFVYVLSDQFEFRCEELSCEMRWPFVRA